MSKKWWIGFIILALVTRTINLDTHAHFLTDESSDLVHMHQFWVEKKLTLVGPVAEDRSHVFSSLIYYMLMPFAAALNFDPLGPVVGMVFYGVLTAVGLVYLTQLKSPRFTNLVAVLAIVWLPLVETSRWAWNPNLIIFWLVWGLVLEARKPGRLGQLLAGICWGLAIHQHYLAIIPVTLYGLWKRSAWFVLGVAAPLVPFVIFDLRHPPGLFIMRNVQYKSWGGGFSFDHQAKMTLDVFKLFVLYFFQSRVLAAIGSVLILGLIATGRRNVWLLIWMVAILAMTQLSPQTHYVLPALTFFVLWLITQTTFASKIMARLITIVMILGSIFALPKLVIGNRWDGNLKLDRKVTDILQREIESKKLINANLAILGSENNFTNGNMYRDLLLVRNVRMRSNLEYTLSDNLFVVTQSDEQHLRKDAALEMEGFRTGPVEGPWPAVDNWRVYQFNRY